ncbi:asparagine synthase C-terminal domain-containing protein [Skermania sp. ID1734]|uniref:asparagine synthase C-terminal domain-containing protein n=1 Tax=Skermania sp. ID1734 TaxID=2597516 RepID=UPI00163D7341|nr:asparagine synthase-related protein [Skermania sp. ID1734]
MLEPTSAQTATPLQYVADHRDIHIDGTARRTATDPHQAAKAVTAEITDRIAAVLDAYPGQPTVLLSGGVDSILVAATAVHLGKRPHAITVVTEGETDDETPARAAAQALNITHDVITLGPADVVRVAKQAVSALDTSELWEIAAAMPILAAQSAIQAHEAEQAGPVSILTGSGADAIFAGGRPVTSPVDSLDATIELDKLVRDEVGKNFVRDRLIPDFYERILGDKADKLIHVFQTERFWELGEQLAPPALFVPRDGDVCDKAALRIACEALLPADAAYLAWTRKSPIQRSSGLFAALADAARAAAAELPGAQTYTDPRTESFEAVATRLYLARLAGNV